LRVWYISIIIYGFSEMDFPVQIYDLVINPEPLVTSDRYGLKSIIMVDKDFNVRRE